jgi:hypothetical protein
VAFRSSATSSRKLAYVRWTQAMKSARTLRPEWGK